MRQFTDSERIARDAAKSSRDVPYLTDDLEHYIFDTGFAAALYHTDRQIAALTAELDSLRELERLAKDVADYIRDTSWSMGPIRKLIQYIDNKDKENKDNDTPNEYYHD